MSPTVFSDMAGRERTTINRLAPRLIISATGIAIKGIKAPLQKTIQQTGRKDAVHVAAFDNQRMMACVRYGWHSLR